MDYVEERLRQLGLDDAAIKRARQIGEPVERLKFTKYPPGTTEKPCTKCKVAKPLAAYMPMKHGALGLHSVCNECRRMIAKEYTKSNREVKAGRERADVCDCCGQRPNRRALHWDHDHNTNQFRGWLCHGCNISLGSSGDSIVRLEALIAYLKRGGGPAK